MPSLIGNKPGQVPSNGDLGTLAFQDSNAVNITGGTVDVSAGTAALPTLGTTGDPNTGVFFPAADTVAVATNGVERVRVSDTGNVLVGTTSATSGGAKLQTVDGITFPATQVASANANTLDDYEEGTWTPVLAFGGASVGITYTAQTGYYTKVGRQVTVNGQITLSSRGSSTGNATITGLPFTIGTGSSCQNVLDPASAFVGLTAGGSIFNSGAQNNTFMYFFIQTTSGRSLATETTFGASSNMLFQLTYFI